jgi:hypothetical protein
MSTSNNKSTDEAEIRDLVESCNHKARSYFLSCQLFFCAPDETLR